MALGDQIQAITNALMESYGDPTLVNGEGPVSAFWDEASATRIQMFIDEKEWDQPAYDVQLPAAVLDAPYSLKNGSYLTWQKHTWRAVVRKVDLPGLNGMNLEVTALVTLTAD